MYFFAFNLEKFTPDRIFYTGSARGARDKYEVCAQFAVNTEFSFFFFSRRYCSLFNGNTHFLASEL